MKLGTFFALLGLAFIVLRLCGVIAWPWWAVTLPLWGSFAFAAALILVGRLGLAVCDAYERWDRRRSRPWEQS